LGQKLPEPEGIDLSSFIRYNNSGRAIFMSPQAGIYQPFLSVHRGRGWEEVFSKKGGLNMTKVTAMARSLLSVFCIALLLGAFAPAAEAKTKKEINASTSAAMARFKKQVKGGTEYLKAAKGVLIMPNITKAGFIIGGQYGQGALEVGGKTVGYYSLAAGSLGWQIGAEQYDMVILFMTDQVLNQFRNSEGWEAGADAEVTLIQVGADVTVETLRSQHPVAGFVFDQKGLMAGVSIRGAKFTPIHPE
jgi:lipid-binding SYLF domain-containing protein